MPHISKKKLDTQITNELRKHLYTLVRNSGSQTRVLIFEELLTKTETIMLAKRIGALLLLKKGLSLYKISRLLGVSPSTVERFKLAMESGKYKNTADWVWKNSKEGSLNVLLTKLISLAFTGRTKSFKKFVDEY